MKKLIAAILMAVVACSCAVSAELRTDVEYAVVDGESLKLDVRVPDGGGPFPVAILVHGGGWSGGDKAREHVPPTAPLTEAKFTWFSINYRLAPRHHWPACIDDVRQAIRWIKAHAAEYKGDATRIVLVGYSAGGHLAAFAAATADDETRVQAVVLFAAPTDLVADCERRGGVSPALRALLGRREPLDGKARRALYEASPVNHLRRGLPPFLLIHGTLDESVLYGQSVKFKKQLDELGVPCELVTIAGAPHDIKTWDSFDAGYKQKMVDWLRRTLATGE